MRGHIDKVRERLVKGIDPNFLTEDGEWLSIKQFHRLFMPDCLDFNRQDTIDSVYFG
jgi:hypothetical protein